MPIALLIPLPFHLLVKGYKLWPLNSKRPYRFIFLQASFGVFGWIILLFTINGPGQGRAASVMLFNVMLYSTCSFGVYYFIAPALDLRQRLIRHLSDGHCQ